LQLDALVHLALATQLATEATEERAVTTAHRVAVEVGLVMDLRAVQVVTGQAVFVWYLNTQFNDLRNS
jgi:hypothetical protein